MKKALIAALVLCSGCIVGSASDTVSKSQTITFPPVPPGLPSITVDEEDSLVFDFSQAISKLQQAGTVSVSLPVNSLTDDNLSFVQTLKLSIVPQDGSMPELVIASLTVPSNTTNTINIPVSVDGVTLANYLGEGPTKFDFVVSGNAATYPTDGLIVVYTVEVDVSLNVNKNITDI